MLLGAVELERGTAFFEGNRYRLNHGTIGFASSTFGPAPPAVAQGVSLRYDLVPFRGAGGMEVLDPRGRPVEEAAALRPTPAGKQGGARTKSTTPRLCSTSTIATRAGSRRASGRGHRRRPAGSSSTSTRARRRASEASRSAGSSPPGGPSS